MNKRLQAGRRGLGRQNARGETGGKASEVSFVELERADERELQE